MVKNKTYNKTLKSPCPARLAQLLQPSLAFCFSLQPMTAYRTVRRHWLQLTKKCWRELHQLCKSRRTYFKFYRKFYCTFYWSCDPSITHSILDSVTSDFHAGHSHVITLEAWVGWVAFCYIALYGKPRLVRFENEIGLVLVKLLIN